MCKNILNLLLISFSFRYFFGKIPVMGFLSETDVVVALDANGVTLQQLEGAVRHTTDRPNNINLAKRIDQARLGIEPGNLTAEDLEEKMRWVLNLNNRFFQENWKIYPSYALDQRQKADPPRVPFLGVDLPLARFGKQGREYTDRLIKQYFDRFELDKNVASEIKDLYHAGFPPTIFTGIPQYGRWGIREILDDVWQYLNREAAVVMTPNHINTGSEVKTAFCGIVSAAYRVLVKDDDPYVKAKVRPYAERLWTPLPRHQSIEIGYTAYAHFEDYRDSRIKPTNFGAKGGEILAYLCSRT